MQQKSARVLALAVLVSVPGFLAGNALKSVQPVTALELSLLALLMALIAGALVTQRSSD
jgi:hypothetical protein